MKKLHWQFGLLAALVMGAGSVMAEQLPPLPVDAQASLHAAGEVEMNGKRYTKLAPTAAAPGMLRAAPTVSEGLFVGDRLLAEGSTLGPVEVSGGIFVRLAPGVSAQQFAADNQLDVVFAGTDIVLFKAAAGGDLLPLLAELERDPRVSQAKLELVGQRNRPQ